MEERIERPEAYIQTLHDAGVRRTTFYLRADESLRSAQGEPRALRRAKPSSIRRDAATSSCALPGIASNSTAWSVNCGVRPWAKRRLPSEPRTRSKGIP